MSNFIKFVLLFLFIVCFSTQQNEVTAQSGLISDAKITIVEYSDYQCPACGYFHPIIEKLKDHYGEKMEVKYRYFPLSTHQFAALAARAAQAAKNQEKFKAMHDMLFENQDSWSSSGNPQAQFENYAREIGLDMEQFREDLNAAETQRIVMEAKKEGQRLGVDATPTFFVNGEKLVQLPETYGQFKRLIDLYLDEAESSN